MDIMTELEKILREDSPKRQSMIDSARQKFKKMIDELEDDRIIEILLRMEDALINNVLDILTPKRSAKAIKLEDLELNAKTYNALKAARIDNVEKLKTYTREELLKFRNFGDGCLADLELKLSLGGHSLGSD